MTKVAHSAAAVPAELAWHVAARPLEIRDAADTQATLGRRALPDPTSKAAGIADRINMVYQEQGEYIYNPAVARTH